MSVIAHSTLAARPVPAVLNDYIWRLSVEQYHDMVQKGILTDEDPVELLEGWLVTKMSKNPPHHTVNDVVAKILIRLLPEDYGVKNQGPVTLADSEPEPDLMIVRGDLRNYLERTPGPADVVLLIEVADSSLDRDRGIKKRLYAAADIATYWIINLIDNRIEVYTGPLPGANPPDYARREDFGPGSNVPIVIDDRVASVRADSLLP